MAFRQGEENEALLNCRKCKGAYPIDALFCGFCGASRSVALGVERDPNSTAVPRLTTEQPSKSKKNLKSENTAQVEPKPDSKANTETGSQNSIKTTEKKSSQADKSTDEVNLPSPSRRGSKKKVVIALAFVAILGASVTVYFLNSSGNVQTASGMTTDGPCAIDDETVAHFVDMKNAIDNIPSGSNEGANKDLILEWAKSAQQTADALKLDQVRAIGSVKTLIYNSSKDLSELANLATQWANKNYSNPETFVADYKAASEKVIADYKLNSEACEERIPRA